MKLILSNQRLKRIMEYILGEGSVTRQWCVSEDGVANDTAGRDLKGLVKLCLLASKGKGRAVRYILAQAADSTEN